MASDAHKPVTSKASNAPITVPVRRCARLGSHWLAGMVSSTIMAPSRASMPR